MAGFTREGGKRVARATQIVEQQYGVRPSTFYRRRFPRGGGGSTTSYGQLIGTAPPGLLESSYVQLETWDRPGFSFIYDNPDADPGDRIKTTAWPENPNLYSSIRGSEAKPVRVWGERYTVEREEVDPEDEEATIIVKKQCFLILGVLDKMASTPGHTDAPDNLKGQGLITRNGSSADEADGGVCGT